MTPPVREGNVSGHSSYENAQNAVRRRESARRELMNTLSPNGFVYKNYEEICKRHNVSALRESAASAEYSADYCIESVFVED